ncbi:MAG: FecR domain-containing protein, partial [Flavitalea sp.]
LSGTRDALPAFEQGALKIIKLDSDQLAYQGSSSIATTTIPAYNTIATPRGSQFQVILPDGTKAWLNAASSLRFPTAFTGNERIVELDGESYFEVAHNASMPFRVKLKGGIDIKVLGTHFNVHAYSDEQVKATLLEGSISLQSEQGSAILKAGQEASVKKSGELTIVKDADIDQAVAWKNGLFDFNKADIGAVMRQIERWYDVEITYQGEIPKKEFVGKFSRDSNISEVLQILELSKIHFIKEGRKIIILP